MVLPTFTEEQILDELVNDYKSIKKLTKKIADSYLKDVQKKGHFIREDEYHDYHYKTDRNNNWYVSLIYNQKNKIPWRFCACCIVQGDKKSKDYFVVRGLNTEKPYYIQYTTHALKRIKERNKYPEDMPLEIIATNIIIHRETIIAVPFVEIKYTKLYSCFDDLNELNDLSYFVLCDRGVFYAVKTPNDNFIFKTYVSTKMAFAELQNASKNKYSKYHKEGQLLYYVMHLHQYCNKWLYDKEVLENYLFKEIDKDDEYDLSQAKGLCILKH